MLGVGVSSSSGSGAAAQARGAAARRRLRRRRRSWYSPVCDDVEARRGALGDAGVARASGARRGRGRRGRRCRDVDAAAAARGSTLGSIAFMRSTVARASSSRPSLSSSARRAVWSCSIASPLRSCFESCSASISRMSSWSGQRSANSFSARNASSILPGLLHPVGVLEEVLLRVAVEALLRADLAELVVDRRAARRVAQDLVAERDGVVEEAAFGVEVDGLLVVVDARRRRCPAAGMRSPTRLYSGDVDVLVACSSNSSRIWT